MVRFGWIVLCVVVGIAVVAAVADIAGFPPSGAAIGGIIGGVVGAMVVAGAGTKTCPRCATELPRYRKPTSLKQALWGGWTCPKCGFEVDRSGHPVATDIAHS
jgi:hypothetical protein